MSLLLALLVSASAQTASIVPRYTLQDAAQGTVTEQTWRGRYVLMFFGYTQCPDVCPTTLLEVGRALRMLGDRASQVQAVFVSVDPKRDTYERLGEYLGHFDSRIIGLTGSPEQLRSATEAFRVSYGYTVDGRDVAQPPLEREDYLVFHGSQLFLLDPEGELVDVFGFGSSAATIATGIQRAMAAR